MAKNRINGELRGVGRVRVIGPTGTMIGAMTVAEALRAAFAAGLDLVEVDRKADPPLCKILDTSRFTYKTAKAASLARRRRTEHK